MAQIISKTVTKDVESADKKNAPSRKPKKNETLAQADNPAPQEKTADDGDDLDRAARSLERAIEMAVQEPSEPSQPTAGEGARPRPTERPTRRNIPSRPRLPANDDRVAVGKLLYGLQRKPSKSPFWAALFMSMAWLVAGAGYGAVMYAPQFAALTGVESFVRSPQLIGLSIILTLPILLFFALAVLVWRAQELRLMAASMSEVAIGLAEPENLANDTITSVGQAIRREVAAMGDGVERAVARAGELEVLVQSQVSAIERSYGENEIRIRRLVEELVDEREAISSHAARIREELGQSHQQLSRELAGNSEHISAAFVEAASKLSETIEGRTRDLTMTLSATSDALSETLIQRGAQLVDSLSARGVEVADTVGAMTMKIEGALDERKNALGKMLDSGGQLIIERIGASIQDLEARKATLANKLDQSGQQMAELVGARIQELEDRKATLADTLNRGGQQMAELVSARIQELEARNGSLADTLDKSGQQMAELIGARIQELEAGKATFAATLNSGGQQMAELIETRVQEIGDTLSQQSTRMDEIFSKRGTELSETIANRAGAVLKALVTHSVDIDSTLQQRLSSIEDTLGVRANEVAERFALKSGELDERLASQIEGLDKTLSQRAQEITEGLTFQQSGLAAQMAEIETNLSDRMLQLDSSLSARSSEIGTRLEAQIRSLDDLVNTRAVGLIAKLGERGTEVVRTLEQRSRIISEAVEATGDTVQRAIVMKSTEATKALAEAGANVVQNLSSHNSQMVESVTNINEQVAGNFERILEGVKKANTALSETLSVAGDNLQTVEQGLSSRADDFRKAIESVSGETSATTERIGGQINALQEISDVVLGEVGKLASRFEQQSQALRESTDTMESSNEKIDATIAARHEALLTLTQSLSGKTEEVNAMMSSFTGMVEESLASAEQTARQIGAMLGENASQSAEQIQGEFGRLQETADEESRRTLESMRGHYSEMQSEIESMLAEARDRFSELTGQVQTASGEIGRELEATRAELRRGFLDAPAEARETTEAMRNMISEQLRAVDELSDIVSRHGMGLNVSKPTALPPVAAAEPPRQAPMRARETVAAAARAANPGGAPAPHRGNGSAVAHPGEAPAARWNLPDLLARASATEGTHPQGRRTAPPPTPQRAPDGAQAAARVRQAPPESEAGRSPLHVVESLNSLSVDLARAIDHEAPRELWERYQKGERGVFTRRLYTLRGQRNFDEIRKKYQTEGEFRSTVDRYVSEFERLIESISRDDRDNTITETYLTSDTGKVYIMLAHASGRFD